MRGSQFMFLEVKGSMSSLGGFVFLPDLVGIQIKQVNFLTVSIGLLSGLCRITSVWAVRMWSNANSPSGFIH